MIVKTTRGNIIDLSYEGHIAVVDTEGRLHYSYGNPDRVTFIRSSLKPIQALVALETGLLDEYDLTNKEISVMCASHIGSFEHVDVVKNLLKKAGLDESYLKCGSHMPRDKESSTFLIKNDKEPTPIFNNCSGKHSGVLLACKQSGEDLATYFKTDHPHQKRILKALSELSDYPEEKIEIAIDGCSLPVHAIPLRNYARAFALIGNPESLDKKRRDIINKINTAMRLEPRMVSGKNKICTDLMKRLYPKVVAKGGANAYYAVAVPEKKLGITVKIESGNHDILPMIVLETLRQIGAITEEEYHLFDDYTNGLIKNHAGLEVGRTSTTFELTKHI